MIHVTVHVHPPSGDSPTGSVTVQCDTSEGTAVRDLTNDSKSVTQSGQSAKSPEHSAAESNNSVIDEQSSTPTAKKTVQLQGNTVQGGMHTTIIQEEESKPLPAIKYGIPLSPDEIYGREEEIKKIHKDIGRKPLAITGLAASGKTALAIHCALCWAEDDNDSIRDVALINAENKTTFAESIKGLAAKLRLDIKEQETDLDILTKKILEFYTDGNRKLVLIYDNMCELKEIKDFIFKRKPNVLLISTTQNTEVGEYFRRYSLDNLTEKGSRELLKAKLPGTLFSNISEENFEKLYDIIDGLAFGLIQSAAHIMNKLYFQSDESEVNAVIAEYIEDFGKYLEQDFPENFQNNNYKILYTALKINIERLRKNSLHILCIMSYMDTAHIYSDTIQKFQKYLSNFGLYNKKYESELRLRDVLRDLVKYSLVKTSEDEEKKQKINIQKLIALVCRKLSGENESKYIANLMLSLSGDDEFVHHSHFFRHAQLSSLEQACKLFVEHPQNSEQVQQLNGQLKKLEISEIVKSWNLVNHVTYGKIFKNTVENTISLLEILKSRDENFSSKKDDNKWNILHVASLNEYYVKVLMENFPELKGIINDETNEGLSALHIAAFRGNKENVSYLINTGCNVNLQDQHGNTAAHLAALFYEVRTLTVIYYCDRFNESINNDDRQSAIDCIGLKVSYTLVHKLSTGEVVRIEWTKVGCTYSVKSLSKEVVWRCIVYWQCVINTEVLQQVITDQLQSCEWWNDSEAAATRDLVSLLGNSWHYPELHYYMKTTNTPVSALLDTLRDDKPHTELDIFIAQSVNRKYKYYYKMISMAIDRVNEVDPDAFTVLGYIALSSNRTITKKVLLRLLTGDEIKLERCLRVLLGQDLIIEYSESVVEVPLISAMMHVYISERGLTREIVSMLLDNPHSTDEQINHYLKTFKL